MILAFVLIILSAVAKGFMDAIKSGKWASDPFWGHVISQNNKWKLDRLGAPMYDERGRRIPRFFGSTTFFVWLTDGWHLMQFFTYNLLIIGCLLFDSPLSVLWDVFILLVLHDVVFEVSYRLIKNGRLF